MRREAVLAGLGLSAHADALADEWDAAVAVRPDGPIEFLDAEYLTGACEEMTLSREDTGLVVDVAGRIASDERLRAVAWYFHYRLFRSDTFDLRAPPLRTSGMCEWPETGDFEHTLDEGAGFVYLLVALSGLPSMRALHRARDLPSAVWDRELADVRHRITRRIERYRDDHGVPGLTRNGGYWVAVTLRGESFRLGRLRFQYARFRPERSLIPLRAFRHVHTGEVLALSADGVRYHESGQLAPEAGSGADVWEASLDRTDGTITGSPIDPTGEAVHTEVALSSADWTEVLSPESPHLRIHIPGDGPMSFAACGEAFARARSFFPRYFPDRSFDTFLCTSWILDAQLQELLSADSNMVRFQRELYLFPTRAYVPNNRRLAKRVLDTVPDDPKPTAAETSLERAILERLADDEALHWRAGGGFLLPDDLAWGGQVYRGDSPCHARNDGT